MATAWQNCSFKLALLVLCSIHLVLGQEAEKKTFTYKTINDQPLQLDVYENLGDRAANNDDGQNAKMPLLYYIHGGGWEFGTKDAVPGYVIDAAKQGGYRLASVQYRLTSEDQKWGGVPAVTWPVQREDVVDGLRFLVSNAEQANFTIDTSRLACWGGSAGGHLCSTLAVYTTYNTSEPRLKAAIPFYGPTDIIDMVLDIDPKVGCHIDHDAVTSFESMLLGSKETHISIKQIREHRDSGDKTVPWPYLVALGQSVNPVRYVLRNTPPMFVAHGTDDHTVPFKQSLRLVNALKNMSVLYELGVAEGCDHGAQPAACWAPTVAKAQKWLLEHL